MSDNNQAQSVIEEAGDFRAYPIGWTVEETEKEGSKSVCVVILFGILQKWHADPEGDGGSWSAEWPSGYASYARVYVVKRDGTLNTGAIENLKKCGIWDGDWSAFESAPEPTRCLIEIQASEWNGRTNYRPEWINPDGDAPQKRSAGLKPANPDVIAGLAARFGGATRAIGGQQVAAVAPPTPAGAPPPPPAPVAVPAAAPAPPAAPPSQPAPFVDEHGQPESPPF